MNKLLKSLGLMRVSEHEAEVSRRDESIASREREIDHVVRERNEALERFKLAATDLAKQAEEIEAYKEGAKALSRIIDSGVDEIKAQQGLVSALTEKNVELVGRIETLKGYHRRDTDEIASLRPDAIKWRASLKRSRDRKAARKGSLS